jgi:hypothetical protein
LPHMTEELVSLIRKCAPDLDHADFYVVRSIYRLDVVFTGTGKELAEIRVRLMPFVEALREQYDLLEEY